MEFVINVSAGIIANFFFSVIIIFLGWLIFVISRRNKLLDFFNINKSKRVVIYLSTLYVKSGGSIGYDGKLRTYQGVAVVLNEQIAANKFRDIMNYLIPSLSDHSSVLSKILFSDIKVSIFPSPTNEQQIDSSTTIITFGSPGYNIVSKYFEEKNETICKFGNDNSQLEVDKLPPIKDPRNGFVQKIYDVQNDRSLFYVAGVAEVGTIGAANFLANEWKRLHKKFGYKKSFLIMLRFQDFDQWTIDFEKEII